MSFTINGETWIPQAASEHAQSWMEKINAILEENNVTDEDGNIIKLSQNFANALYLQVLAGSSRLALNDEKLNAGINSFNIEACDDAQIENLLPIAAITRNPGSYSTLVLTATAGSDGVCTIPEGTRAPFGSVNFVVKTTAVIQPGETQNIETVCDTTGSIVVLKGEITAFATQIANLENVVNNVSSIPGNNAETTDSLRRRIIRGNTIPYSLDGVKTALEELTGINYARVFFNYNTSGTITLNGGIILQPRTAYIVVNGSSDELADTYARYMSAPTQNSPGASPTGTYSTVALSVTAGAGGATVPGTTTVTYRGNVFALGEDAEIAAGATESLTFTAEETGPVVIPSGAITAFDQSVEGVESVSNAASVPGHDRTAWEQNYVTASGQIIPIKYDTSEDEIVYVKITLSRGESAEEQVKNQLKRDLIASSAGWAIGQNVTSLLTSVPYDKCTYTDVAYTQVSTDGSNWGNIIETPANAIPRVTDDSIIIEVLS